MSSLDYHGLRKMIAADGLDIFGGFNAKPADALPAETRTLLLLGPREPGFWPRALESPEFRDNTPDPLDRWSTRVIERLAREAGGHAAFPFGGPPYQPFVTWALRSGRSWTSPVGLLVHDVAGLFVSYRGALLLPYPVTLPDPSQRPCDTCADQPCRSACPVHALSDEGYQLERCHAFLNTEPGLACMSQGCAVRRACPVSAAYGRFA